MASYDIVQSIFLMGQAAGGVADISGSQSHLRSLFALFLQGSGSSFRGFFPQFNGQMTGNDWRVAWGPCVYCANPTYGVATNSMYVAYSPSTKTYVVAIAGTDFESLTDWIDEDGNVAADQMAPWPLKLPYTPPNPPAPPTGPAISGGTALGVSNLLTQSAMVDPQGGSLATFLNSKVDGATSLVFTGHSLGGALAPTVALHLYPQPKTSGWQNVFVLPSAGATPGNGGFADLYDAPSAYAPVVASGARGPWTHWNCDYANRQDLIPRAWNGLASVCHLLSERSHYYWWSIYGVLNSAAGATLFSTMQQGEGMAAGGGYIHITHKPFSPDWGVWNWTNGSGQSQYPPVWQALPYHTFSNPITVEALFGYIDAAHIDQYQRFFQVTPPQPLPPSLAGRPQRPVGLAARKLALRSAAAFDVARPTSADGPAAAEPGVAEPGATGRMIE